MDFIRYKFASQKALAAIHWMIQQTPRLDLHTMLKAVYFADKTHLNKYGKPIFGARYRAMRFGPVPIEIYEMAKCEPLWLAELHKEQFPWSLISFRLILTDNSAPDLAVLSDTDREELEAGLKLSGSMTFDARTAATHGPDWQKANLGLMRYEDMLTEAADKEQRVAYLRESASTLRL
jgi:hypothetical protein